MARTNSARSSVSRDQASSPPKAKNEPQSQRATRSTRSQSKELGGDREAVNSRRAGKRGARQASVDSVESNTSATSSKASSRGGRSRKVIRKGTAARDLSTVAEDHEPKVEEVEDERIEDDEDDRNQRALSPGGLSQMSGTTARTSHSHAEIAALDPILVEILPQLFSTSYHILDLLAPLDSDQEVVENIVRDLKILGSPLAKRLRHYEELFNVTRAKYGSDRYISTSFILRRLLGNGNLAEANFRPDAALHTANMATLLKEFFVLSKESPQTPMHLGVLDNTFPNGFAGKFVENPEYGNSALLDEFFKMGLQIRTQMTIINLAQYQEHEDFNPEDFLATTFFEVPSEQSQGLSVYEDAVKNGQPKPILHGGPPNSDKQNDMILEEVMAIKSAFRESEAAEEAGDLIDFDLLDGQFPWMAFLTNMVQWSRARLNEIAEDVKEQGGIESITEALAEIVANNDSQVEKDDLYRYPPSAVQPRLLPPAEFIQSSGTNSLYRDGQDARNLRKLKRGTSSSYQQKPKTKQSSPFPQPVSKSTGSLRQEGARPNSRREISVQLSDDLQPDTGGDDDDIPPGGTAPYMASWDGYANERNKENRKPGAKMSLLDRQPNAVRVSWDSQESEAGPSTKKRQREEHTPSAESEDGGFQEDTRIPSSARKATRPAPRPVPESDGPTPPKRARFPDRPVSSNAEGSLSARQRREAEQRQAAESKRQANSRLMAVDEDDEDVPSATFESISNTARFNAAAATIKRKERQTRVPWSEADSQFLIDAIQEFGCSWAIIHKLGGWEYERDQVALKDKARNMKVVFLRSGVAPKDLPRNFDKISLGQKEINAVRSVIPDYEA